MGSLNSAWSCWYFDSWIWWWWSFSVEQGIFLEICSHYFLAFNYLLLWYSSSAAGLWNLISVGFYQVTTSIYNLILGKLYCDHYGTMRLQGNRDYSCKLKFKEQSIIDRNPHQVNQLSMHLANMNRERHLISLFELLWVCSLALPNIF